MGVKQSFKYLETKIQQKNLIFIEGNVHDTFLEEREIYSLKDKIKDIVKKMEYDILECFDPNLGKYNILNEENKKIYLKNINIWDLLND